MHATTGKAKSKGGDSAHQSAEQIQLGKMADAATKDPKRFGKLVHKLLPEAGESVDYLAEEFKRRKLLPQDGRYLHQWLGGNDRPIWTAKHLDAILDVVDKTPEEFQQEFGSGQNGNGAGGSKGATNGGTPAVPPELPVIQYNSTHMMLLLQYAGTHTIETNHAVLTKLGIQQEKGFADLAHYFKAKGKNPDTAELMGKWLHGKAAYNYGSAQLHIVVTYLGVKPDEFLAFAKTFEGDKPPPLTPRQQRIEGSRKAFGKYLEMLVFAAHRKPKDVHDYLLEKQIVEGSAKNTQKILDGSVSFYKTPFCATIAEYLGVTEDMLLDGFDLHQKGKLHGLKLNPTLKADKPDDKGKSPTKPSGTDGDAVTAADVGASAPADAPVEEASAEATGIDDTTEADKAEDVAAGNAPDVTAAAAAPDEGASDEVPDDDATPVNADATPPSAEIVDETGTEVEATAETEEPAADDAATEAVAETADAASDEVAEDVPAETDADAEPPVAVQAEAGEGTSDAAAGEIPAETAEAESTLVEEAKAAEQAADAAVVAEAEAGFTEEPREGAFENLARALDGAPDVAESSVIISPPGALDGLVASLLGEHEADGDVGDAKTEPVAGEIPAVDESSDDVTATDAMMAEISPLGGFEDYVAMVEAERNDDDATEEDAMLDADEHANGSAGDDDVGKTPVLQEVTLRVIQGDADIPPALRMAQMLDRNAYRPEEAGMLVLARERFGKLNNDTLLAVLGGIIEAEAEANGEDFPKDVLVKYLWQALVDCGVVYQGDKRHQLLLDILSALLKAPTREA